MPTQAAQAAVVLLSEAFPRNQITEGTAAIYARALSGLEPELLGRAVEWYTLSGVHFPAIAEIMRAAAELALKLPEPEEALYCAMEKLLGRDVGMHPDVRAAWDVLGGASTARELLISDMPTYRAQFRKAYEGIRETIIMEWVDEHGSQRPV